MARALVIFTLGLGLSALSCHSDGGNAKPGVSPAPNGGSGAGTGGSGGGTGGTISGAGGTGGTISGTGGTGGTGGTAGAGGSAPDATPVSGGMGGGTDGPMSMARDATASDHPASNDAGDGLGGDPLPGRPANRICPKSYTTQQCCAFLCTCVNTLCTDSPKAKPGLAGCMASCMGQSDMRVRCRVFHCFESKSPSGIRDHDSHCGHAAGTVNGGDCPPAVYQ